MTAKTERERDDWIGQIGLAIVKHSSMYVNDEADDDIDGTESTVPSGGKQDVENAYKTS